MSNSVLFTENVKVGKFTKNGFKEISNSALLTLNKEAPFSYFLEIKENINNEILLQLYLNKEFNISLSFINIYIKIDLIHNGKNVHIGVVFLEKERFKSFIDTFFIYHFEATNLRNFVSDDLQAIKSMIYQCSLDSVSEDSSTTTSKQTCKQQKEQKMDNGGKYSHLRIGHKEKNCFIMKIFDKTCDIGIFNQDRDLSFNKQIKNIANPEGKTFIASDMLTYNSDHSLLLLNRHSSIISNLNLDRGIVTNKYDLTSKLILQPLGIIHRFYDNSSDPVFITFDERDTKMIDTRTKELVVNSSAYKTCSNFSAAQTTKNGRIAIGSENGIVRLYSEPCLTRATVNFEIGSRNDEITSIDISPDECWVLATCHSFISIFCVQIKSSGRLAFDAQMKKEKTSDIKLQLTQEDQLTIKSSLKNSYPFFSNAKFVWFGGKINYIIASYGPAIIRWPFDPILKGEIPKSQILHIYNEQIVDSNVFDQTNDIVFISQNEISVLYEN